MSRIFDTRPNIFSSGGHLDQVEYAMEAVANSGRILGIRTESGVLLVAENMHYDQLMDDENLPTKIYKINDEILCAITGIASDGHALLEKMQLYSQQFQLRFQRSVPCENLVQYICSHKQACTHFNVSRPYGVSILFVSWSPKFGYELYHSNPSGDYNSWRAICVGKNCQKVKEFLIQKLNCDAALTLNDAVCLAFDCLNDQGTLHPKMLQMAKIERKDDKTVITRIPANDIWTLFNSSAAQNSEFELNTCYGPPLLGVIKENEPEI